MRIAMHSSRQFAFEQGDAGKLRGAAGVGEAEGAVEGDGIAPAGLPEVAERGAQAGLYPEIPAGPGISGIFMILWTSRIPTTSFPLRGSVLIQHLHCLERQPPIPARHSASTFCTPVA